MPVSLHTKIDNDAFEALKYISDHNFNWIYDLISILILLNPVLSSVCVVIVIWKSDLNFIFRSRREGDGDRGDRGDRGGYRKAAGEGDKVADAGAGAAPMEFRGGYGRGGKPAQ